MILVWTLAVSATQAAADARLRRPISPSQPMWLVHIDTWNYADPQKIIDLVPADIRCSRFEAVDVCSIWL